MLYVNTYKVYILCLSILSMNQMSKKEMMALSSNEFRNLGVQIDYEYVQTLANDPVVAKMRKDWKAAQKELFLASMKEVYQN